MHHLHVTLEDTDWDELKDLIRQAEELMEVGKISERQFLLWAARTAVETERETPTSQRN